MHLITVVFLATTGYAECGIGWRNVPVLASAGRCSQDEAAERIIKRLRELMGGSMRRLTKEIVEVVRKELRRAGMGKAEPKKKSLDEQIAEFADKIKDDKDIHSRLRKFLKTKSGRQFVKEQMETMGVTELEDATQFYFSKQKDGTYVLKPEYVDQTRNLLDQMEPPSEKPKKKARMGFSDDPLSDEARKALGLRPGQGIKIGKVIPGGPCDKAGMKKGDVILSVGGKDVGESTLAAVLAKLNPGAAVEVVVLREGKRVALRVVLGEKR